MKPLDCRFGLHDDKVIEESNDRANSFGDWCRMGAFRIATTTKKCLRCGRIKINNEPWGHYY